MSEKARETLVRAPFYCASILLCRKGVSLLARPCFCGIATATGLQAFAKRRGVLESFPTFFSLDPAHGFLTCWILLKVHITQGGASQWISMESMDLRGCESLGKGFLPPSPLIPGQGITSLKNCLHSLLGFIHCVVSEGLWGLDFLSPWIPVGLG